jgi:hypothetical protein
MDHLERRNHTSGMSSTFVYLYCPC